MTKVYFVRHADADNSVQDEMVRPLSEKGRRDCALVTEFLRDKNINAVLSSPYRRAVDTIFDFAKSVNQPIQIVNDFREGKLSDVWVEDFKAVYEKQWADFNCKLPDGESLAEVQARNIAALTGVLKAYQGKIIAIGTHGAALSTIINYYDRTFGFEDFVAIANVKPWVVIMDFLDDGSVGIEKIDLFRL